MALNNYENDGSGSDDAWELVGEGALSSEFTPLATETSGTSPPTAALVATSSYNNGHEEEGGDDAASVASGVSSITGDNHANISDVEDGEDNEGGNVDVNKEAVLSQSNLTNDCSGNEEVLAAYYDDKLQRWVFPNDGVSSHPEEAPGGASGDANEENAEEGDTDGPGNKEDAPDDSDLVETLSNMGFTNEQIHNAVNKLREDGSEIDADTVIGEMTGENNPPVERAWNFVESSVRDFERQHELRRRTSNIARNVGNSACQVLSNVREESERFRDNLRETCSQADMHARSATTSVKSTLRSAGDTARRANQEHRILEKVATGAAVAGALLVAVGNPRAGVGAMAVAGASLAAGEAMKQSSHRETRDHGLGRGVHLD